MSTTEPPCPATLRHAHGVTTCELEPDQHDDGKHRGICYACLEDGEPAALSWAGEGRTEWAL